MTSRVYKAFLNRVNKYYSIDKSINLIEWYESTYKPSKSGDWADEKAYLSESQHKLLASSEMTDLLSKLLKQEISESLTPEENACVNEIKRKSDYAIKIPKKLIIELSKAQTKSYNSWLNAKRKSDYNLYKKDLENVTELAKKKIEYLGFNDYYEGFLDENEPGLKKEYIEPLFNELKSNLKIMINKIEDEGIIIKPLKLKDFNVKNQELLSKMILNDMGFDFSRGRIYLSDINCMLGTLDDVRLVIECDKKNLSGILGALHEGGHGLYEQGYDYKYRNTPMASCNSTAYDESQAKFYENMIGQSREFLMNYYPLMKRLFPQQLGGLNMEDFYKSMNIVKNSLVRLEADELTYNMHIILRHELEKELLDGRIRFNELREAWNDKTHEFFGLKTTSDASGVLQDTHWSEAGYGYFPTYTLGNLYAAQYHNKLKQKIPELNNKIDRGVLRSIKGWLNKNIHEKGVLYNADELTKQITGESLKTDYYINYLKEKYGDVYGINFSKNSITA